MDFLAAYRGLTVREYAGLFASAVLVAGLLLNSAPWLAALYLAKDTSPRVLIASPEISYGESPQCTRNAANQAAEYQLLLPVVIRQSESPTLTFRIKLSRSFHILCGVMDHHQELLTIAAKANLISSAFDIEPSTEKMKEGQAEVEWSWVISPKRMGRHDLLLGVAGKKGFIADLSLVPKSQGVVRQSRDDLQINIEVLSPLGLTSFYDALFKTIGAILGVLGVILGFPFFKKLFESKASGSR